VRPPHGEGKRERFPRSCGKKKKKKGEEGKQQIRVKSGRTAREREKKRTPVRPLTLGFSTARDKKKRKKVADQDRSIGGSSKKKEDPERCTRERSGEK